MILADTSVWIEHFRGHTNELREHLDVGEILIHPAVIGELALGSIPQRRQTLALLGYLPHTTVASDDECLAMIESLKLNGSGLGWVDVQLFAAARLSHCRLWTLDKALSLAASKHHV